MSMHFRDFDLGFDQKNMQSYLGEVCLKEGFEAALERLVDWSYETGYLTPEKLSDNPRFSYKDADTGVTFKTQVNIARSKYSPKPVSGGPKLHCPICFENVGIPGKENLRVMSFEMPRERSFFAQLTPFPLFENHFVLVSHEATPMIVSRQSIEDMVHVVTLAPHYVLCSNSDVEWAGASILVHHHYQAFKRLHLPIMEAGWFEACSTTSAVGHATVEWGFLNYPIATLKLLSADANALTECADHFIRFWKSLVPGKNTFNLIVRCIKGQWEAYLILRNPDHRTQPERTVIKSEGVGIIEVAGEGIYPVPIGEHAAKLNQQIEENGLDIIKGIISDNNPVASSSWVALFEQLKADLLLKG